VSTTGQHSQGPVVSPATVAEWRRRQEACSEVLPSPEEGGGQHANGFQSNDHTAMNGSTDRGAMNGSTDRGAMNGSTDRGAMNGSTDRGAMNGSTDRGAMNGSTDRGAMNGSTDRGAMNGSTDRGAMNAPGSRVLHGREDSKHGTTAGDTLPLPVVTDACKDELIPAMHAAEQAEGLRALLLLAESEAGETDAPAVYPFPVDHVRGDGGVNDSYRSGDPPDVPPRQGGDGSLAHSYEIPRITFRPRRWLALLPLAVIAGGSLALHRSFLGDRVLSSPVLLAAWVIALGFVLAQLVLAWRQRPFTVTQRQRAQVDRLFVTVVIPCYNEDAPILDRTVASIMQQTRLPQHVEVVDDGSKVDYAEVREWWEAHSPPGVRFTWVRQANAGKKHAQSVTFTSDPQADIFVTIDSDSALDSRAIEEGLKPFADPGIVSVAGLETAINYRANLLTRAIAARSIAFQLFAMSAQSAAGGSVLINPGAFSLYRAWLIRAIVPAYLGETFFGTPVTLGDDTALTMFALLAGRAVHQPTAVCMPVYPETLAHHLRQWTRWMRASTIRTFWRLRYLPVTSYGWVYCAWTLWAFLTSVALSLAIPLAWPGSRNLLIVSGVALLVWPWSIAVRLATVRRSDQGFWQKMAGVALLPVAALWYLLVLRQIRFYGIATCARQHWVTRQEVEVRIGEQAKEMAAS
jgi:hyaluronan synthase